MQLRGILRILGLLLMVFSLSMLPPIPVSLWYGENQSYVFFTAFILTLLNGFLLWLPFRRDTRELGTRDGFLIVALLWTVLSLYGALPFLLATNPHIHWTDAIFESISGLTTTGASIFAKLDILPKGLRYYRQQLQFLGGMGIIVLAVAILPMLGIGGMQLYRAETPGPLKDAKLTPRITATAKILWLVYLGLQAACILTFWLCGMNLFDAVGESFSTVATGGFSLHDAGFAYYHSSAILMGATVFMFLGGTNFALHYLAWHRRSLKTYLDDAEFRGYVGLCAVILFFIFIGLLVHRTFAHTSEILLNTVFDTVSMLTTTGFTASPIQYWPTYLPFLLMIAALIGGCGGSTTGGIKIIRVLLLVKQGRREVHRLIHPHAIVPLKFGRQILPEPLVQAMWGFISAFFALFIILLLVLLAFSLDLTTAMSALVACLANAGAGVGEVAHNFAALPHPVKWILSFAMIAGRLEVFTVLVLLSPGFWRA